MTIIAAVICLEAYKKADTAIKKQPSITIFDIHFYPSSSIYLNVTMKWVIMNEKLGLNVEKTSQMRGELEAAPGFEPGMKVLQTFALPLGDAAISLYSTLCIRSGFRTNELKSII